MKRKTGVVNIGKDLIMKDKKGLALLTVVLFIFSLAVMGMTLLAIINIDTYELNAQYQELQAFYLAEAGVEKALWYLNKGQNPSRLECLQDPYGNKIGCYKINTSGVNPKNIKSQGKIKDIKIEIEITAYDNPLTESVDYSFVLGSWKRKFIK